MKGLIIISVIFLFTLSFTVATLGTGATMLQYGYGDNPNSVNSNNNTPNESVNIPNNEQNSAIDSSLRDRIKSRIENRLTDEQINKIFAFRNRIKNYIENRTCPDNCTCTSSVTKCWLANGTREMTVLAGKSGNIIIQIKGINATTNVTLYKSDDGKLYAVMKNNETKRIRYMPDQVRERIIERFETRFENENITLDENGTYNYDAEKNATLLFFFHIRENVKVNVDSETGEVTNIRSPWWAFMAKDENQLVGASCGTVTPGQNDACCQNKTFDFWNVTANECQFNQSS